MKPTGRNLFHFFNLGKRDKLLITLNGGRWGGVKRALENVYKNYFAKLLFFSDFVPDFDFDALKFFDYPDVDFFIQVCLIILMYLGMLSRLWRPTLRTSR